MKTVKEIKESLSEYDDDNFIYAYEGEMIGLVIVDENDNEIGSISAEPDNTTHRDWLYPESMIIREKK